MGDLVDISSRTKKAKPVRPELPPAQQALHPRARRATEGARALAAAQSSADRARYTAARARQETEKLLATGTVVPGRITIALYIRGLEGPQVDIDCGAEEPDVDEWELGIKQPTADQVRKLAELTGFPIPFFYQPIVAQPMTTFICRDSGPMADRFQRYETDGIPVPPAAAQRGKPVQGNLF